MGCGTSSVMESPQKSSSSIARKRMRTRSTVEEYVRLDEEISEMEATCPGPRLATAEAWIEHLQEKRDALLMTADAVQYDLVTDQSIDQSIDAPITKEIAPDSPNKDLARLVLSLGVVLDKHKAAAQEDFFANLSKSSLHTASMKYYNEILEHTRSRVKVLTENYKTLTDLYVQQDGIIALISGGTYMTSYEENLDAQLETARDVRDKLGSTLEQWRICGLLLRACAKSASQSFKLWKDLKTLRSPRDMVNVALECRNSIQASLISVECAQLSLPNVEIMFVSNRQILAVNHINTYMLTDIADESRFNHAAKVLEMYEDNMHKASSWLYDTYNKTLQKDFNKAEESVKSLAKKLRNHRHEMFIRETTKK